MSIEWISLLYDAQGQTITVDDVAAIFLCLCYIHDSNKYFTNNYTPDSTKNTTNNSFCCYGYLIYFCIYSKGKTVNLLSILFKLPHSAVWMDVLPLLLQWNRTTKALNNLFVIFVVLCSSFFNIDRLICSETINYNMFAVNVLNDTLKNHWLLGGGIVLLHHIILLLGEGDKYQCFLFGGGEKLKYIRFPFPTSIYCHGRVGAHDSHGTKKWQKLTLLRTLWYQGTRTWFFSVLASCCWLKFLFIYNNSSFHWTLPETIIFQTSCSNCVTMLSCRRSFPGDFDFSSRIDFSKFQVWHRRALPCQTWNFENHSNRARYFIRNPQVYYIIYLRPWVKSYLFTFEECWMV